MRNRGNLKGLLLGILVIAGQGVIAQTREVSVPFLRAAIGSLADRTTVTLEAVYLPDPGLVESTGRYMRGKGFSRFSIRDPQSVGIFTSMYCAQDNKAFKELLTIQEPTRVRLYAYKDSGENSEAALLVTGMEVMAEPVKKVMATQGKVNGPFRVTIKDTTSGTKTILTNVMVGKSYTIEGMTLMIELEKELEAQEGELSGTL